jgi:putative transposase
VVILGSVAPQCDNLILTSESCRSGERQPQNPPKGWYSSNDLPHLDSANVIQHVTYRLADSLPQAVLVQMQTELEERIRNQDERQIELRRRIEAYIDAGHGSCVLQHSDNAECMVDTWFRFDGERYRLLEWVVMPNHCHVLIEPFEGIPLSKIALSWKNYTARRINRKTNLREKHSQVWQRDYWDRFIRDEDHYMSAKKYIAMNPVKAGLVVKPEDWTWSSARYLVHERGR